MRTLDSTKGILEQEEQQLCTLPTKLSGCTESRSLFVASDAEPAIYSGWERRCLAVSDMHKNETSMTCKVEQLHALATLLRSCPPKVVKSFFSSSVMALHDKTQMTLPFICRSVKGKLNLGCSARLIYLATFSVNSTMSELA